MLDYSNNMHIKNFIRHYIFFGLFVFCGMQAEESAVQLSVNALVTPTEWNELHLDDLITVFEKHVTTKFGKLGIDRMFSSDINKSVMENRQTIIKELVTNESLFTDLQKNLMEIDKGAEALLSCSSGKTRKIDSLYYNFPYDSRLAAFFPIDKFLNNSSCTIEASMWTTLYGYLVAATLPFWNKIYSCGKDYNIRRKETVFQNLTSELQKEIRQTLDQAGLGKDLSDEDCMKYWLLRNKKANWDAGSAGDRYHLVKCVLGSDTIVSNVSAGLSVMGYTFITDLGRLGLSATIFATTWQLWSDLRMLQKELVAVASITRSLDNMIECINTIGKKNAYIPSEQVRYLLNKEGWSNYFHNLVDLLKTSTFDSSNSYFYSRGKMLRAYRLLEETKEEIKIIVQAIAEFDACGAFAKFYKQQRGKNGQFAFVQFVEADKPQVMIKDVWTPLVGPENAVTNDVLLGVSGQPIRAIITGPNGCGKSTYLKAIGHAVFIAHVCGIVPGSMARMTFFDNIRTSLNPQENLLQGISAFMAQKIRIDELFESMKQSSANKKMLMIFDDPFNGTTDTQIARRIYKLGLDAGHLPYVCVCIATDVEKPAQLVRKGSFSNYQVEIKELGFGEFVCALK